LSRRVHLRWDIGGDGGVGTSAVSIGAYTGHAAGVGGSTVVLLQGE